MVLRGDPSLHAQNVSLKKLSRKWAQSIEQLDGEVLKIPSSLVEKKLTQYEEVFQKLKGLPPLRRNEHSIVLQSGS